MKRFFTIFALLMVLFGTTQMSIAAALPMEHMSADMHSMVEMGSDVEGAVKCVDQPSCELQSSCGGHLCSVISAEIPFAGHAASFIKTQYELFLVSIHLSLKDRPPQSLMN